MASSQEKTAGWVLIVAILLLIVIIVVGEIPILRYTQGNVVYPMDDAFIHLSVAKNIVHHGVWGANPVAFESASSSILYPIILAFFILITGLGVVLPFAVNLAAGILVLIIARNWLRRQGVRPLHQLFVLLALILAAPLPYIIRLGMEHTLQLLFDLLFFMKFTDFLQVNIGSDVREWKVPGVLLLYGSLVTGIRYEGVFIISCACLILLYYRQFVPVLMLGVCAAVPILLFGFYSISKGAYFLPNPVLLKSSTPHLGEVFDKVYYFYPSTSAAAVQRLIFLLPGLFLLFRTQIIRDRVIWSFMLLLFGVGLMHLILANTNWFFRYESYLISLFVLIVGAILGKYARSEVNVFGWKRWGPVVLAGVFILYPFYLRGKEAFGVAKPACLNLYDQDYHVAKFLHRYYDSTRIAFNDLGCITYYTSAKSLDLVGLGNNEVARAKRDKYYNAGFLSWLIQKEQIKLVVVFDRLLPPDLMAQWQKVATWHFEHQIIPGDQDYSFYAVDSSLASGLRSHLRAYSEQLPSGVSLHFN